MTFRRCSCALCCLPKTQAFTGIAASTCAAPRAERRQSPSNWPRTCSCRATSSSDPSCRNWRSRSCSSRADQYQSSFAHGTPGPGLRSLIDEPLAKLRSLSAAARPDDRWRIETAGKGSTKSPSSSVLRLYRTPVGVISGLILFRLVAFWGRSAIGWSVSFSLGEFLVEGLLLGRLLRLSSATLQTTSIARPGNAAAAPLHRRFPIVISEAKGLF